MFKNLIKKTITIVIIIEDFTTLSDLHDALYGIPGVRIEQVCSPTMNIKTVTLREDDIVTLLGNLANKDLSIRSQSGNTIMFKVRRNEAA